MDPATKVQTIHTFNVAAKTTAKKDAANEEPEAEESRQEAKEAEDAKADTEKVDGQNAAEASEGKNIVITAAIIEAPVYSEKPVVNRLVLELIKVKDGPVGTSIPSPILQLDGSVDVGKLKYTFVSNYHEDDILFTLDEIFPEKSVILESQVQCRPRSADYLYTLVVKVASGQKAALPKVGQLNLRDYA